MSDNSIGASHSDLGVARWRKSTFSCDGECVEVAETDGGVAVRNSNDPGAGMVIFTPAEMAAWIEGIKAGEFDDLA